MLEDFKRQIKAKINNVKFNVDGDMVHVSYPPDLYHKFNFDEFIEHQANLNGMSWSGSGYGCGFRDISFERILDEN